jgi:hypothetical protein
MSWIRICGRAAREQLLKAVFWHAVLLRAAYLIEEGIDINSQGPPI